MESDRNLTGIQSYLKSRNGVSWFIAGVFTQLGALYAHLDYFGLAFSAFILLLGLFKRPRNQNQLGVFAASTGMFSTEVVAIALVVLKIL